MPLLETMIVTHIQVHNTTSVISNWNGKKNENNTIKKQIKRGNIC